MEWFGANRLSKILNHFYRYIIKNTTDILGICLWSLCLKRVSFICSFVVSTIDFLTQFETNSSFFSGPCCHSFPNPVFGQLTCSTSEVGNSQLIQYIFWWNFGNFPMKSIPIPRCLMYGIFSYIYRQNVGNRPYIEHLGLSSMGRLGTFAGFMNVFGFFVTLRITFPLKNGVILRTKKHRTKVYRFLDPFKFKR